MERDSADDPEMAVRPAGATAAVEQLLADNTRHITPAEVPGQQAVDGVQGDLRAGSAAQPGDRTSALLTAIAAAVRELADSSERHHARAEQREGVIDHLHSEVDRLRHGERRGLLRPLLVEICRLRDDLLRQADGLPDEYDSERAGVLLRSYAESVELALENSGVVTFEPDSGDPFEPRMHRRVGAEPTSNPALAGRVARIRRSGYLDVDANTPIAPAEVVVFAAVSGEPTQVAPPDEPRPVTADPETSHPASRTDKRDEL